MNYKLFTVEQVWYLVCQREGVVRFHSDSQDSLVAIDDGMRNRSQRGIANLQTHTSDVSHTLDGDRELKNEPEI